MRNLLEEREDDLANSIKELNSRCQEVQRLKVTLLKPSMLEMGTEITITITTTGVERRAVDRDHDQDHEHVELSRPR